MYGVNSEIHVHSMKQGDAGYRQRLQNNVWGSLIGSKAPATGYRLLSSKHRLLRILFHQNHRHFLNRLL